MLNFLFWFSLCSPFLAYTHLVLLQFVPPLCKCSIEIATCVCCLEKVNYPANSGTNDLAYLFTCWHVFPCMLTNSRAIKYVIVTKKLKIIKGLIMHTFLYLVENCYMSIFFELARFCLVKHKLHYSLWRLSLIFNYLENLMTKKGGMSSGTVPTYSPVPWGT
jgi:hypothetical protein